MKHLEDPCKRRTLRKIQEDHQAEEVSRPCGTGRSRRNCSAPSSIPSTQSREKDVHR